MAKKRIIGIMGLGHVGAHVAYSLAIQGIADELVLADQNQHKLASEVQDLRDAVAVAADDVLRLAQAGIVGVGQEQLVPVAHLH